MLFQLDGKELESFNKWDKDHKKVCVLYNSPIQPAIGGRLTFSFTPTGIGTGVYVKCKCGDEKSCTNIDSW